MDIHHTARGSLVLTDAIRQYAEDKFNKILAHHSFGVPIQRVFLTYGIERYMHRFTLLVYASHHMKIRAEASTKDLYASIDAAFSILEAKFKKFHDLMKDHHVKTGKMEKHLLWEDDTEIINREIESENFKEMKEALLPPVTRQSKQLLKTLLVEEAIMKMELSDEACMIFKDERSQNLMALYKRKNGSYGVSEVVEPT
ncbi:MAG: ribosome hibernation promotion factor [Chlamydiia bacterium]